MIEQAFEVATEFRFDIGQALLNTKTLTNAVDDLSSATNKGMGLLNYMAGGLVARLGMGSGGLLGILSKAVEVSEQFHASSLGLSNNIMENFTLLSGTINTFNDRLRTSEMIMANISDTAIKFGIDTTDLANITQRLSTPLAQRGKLGTNYEGAIGMAKNLTLASINTGINPGMATESLYRALSEHMPLHGQLFARLANTQAFKQAHVVTQGQLQNMNQDKKIDLLNKALESLAMNSEELASRLHTLKTQFVIIKNQVMVLLKPIGDALKEPIIKVMEYLNKYLAENGAKIGKTIGKMLSNLTGDPKDLLVNILQIKALGKDVKSAFKMVEVVTTFRFLKWILMDILGLTFNGGLVRAAFTALKDGFMWIVAIVPWAKLLSGVFSLLRSAVASVLEIFGPFLFFFQILSRARAIAKINDVELLATLAPKFGDAFLKMKVAIENIMMPISMAIDWWAQLLSPIFEMGFWLKVLLPIVEGLAGGLDLLGTAMVYIMAALSGWISMIMGFMIDLSNLKNPFADTLKNFGEGYHDFLDKNAARLGQDGLKATANVVNNNHIEARFDMREQLEPDRIAFAVTKHLSNLSMNPTQSVGKSFRGLLPSADARSL